MGADSWLLARLAMFSTLNLKNQILLLWAFVDLCLDL